MIRPTPARAALSVAAALITLPVLAKVEAHAVESSSCAAVPRTPTYSHHNSVGQKVLAYTVDLRCTLGNRTVAVNQEVLEQDGPKSLLHVVERRSFTVGFVSAGSTQTTFLVALPDTEEGPEEMYHRIRIQVSSNGVTAPWTWWHASSVLATYN